MIITRIATESTTAHSSGAAKFMPGIRYERKKGGSEDTTLNISPAATCIMYYMYVDTTSTNSSLSKLRFRLITMKNQIKLYSDKMDIYVDL